MYEALISHEAGKYYKKQDKGTKRRLNKCIDDLSREPLFGQHIKKLYGELEGKLRYRMGNIRIVYEVNIKDKTIEIKSVRGRGDILQIRVTDRWGITLIPLLSSSFLRMMCQNSGERETRDEGCPSSLVHHSSSLIVRKTALLLEFSKN
ncbi:MULTISPECIES: type II toxin-antitoxin system RelE/ParE family toxin [Candidatus Kuenenia]|jgi:mRNA-degrading endonuclease RelE of RelBE toxin-antitoxin system|uniref:Uncharacterized protein n=1 Tax=Kuenenia stuttgartiensis TaxID=174633 RepID=Q1Q5M0_KUEST|nr:MULTISPECIES: type II toxin-antitoxin system RelE/ParE family toxin [Kuenenia]MBE7549316.1 type II toxin-antitoxin system RelE/ParE family toxin [Planctomycetia bacterium]MCF6150748.1 type II toxin-antitoxin system RelE/ParE family toxin [Candidatus Kuenenia stuttgartiensis]MCZ7624101.1 type II toxin-antitoxin system RelE/ParE family toxin [Candidatus Kuenenia sp.]TVM02031.1 MAG: hypothetical protein CV080_02315 [Candidatus Kuenenia stuttgartiensis]CAJ75316.1 conserved hypothetical protein 